MYGYAVMLHKE